MSISMLLMGVKWKMCTLVYIYVIKVCTFVYIYVIKACTYVYIIKVYILSFIICAALPLRYIENTKVV
jgi:hypothetical protein